MINNLEIVYSCPKGEKDFAVIDTGYGFSFQIEEKMIFLHDGETQELVDNLLKFLRKEGG